MDTYPLFAVQMATKIRKVMFPQNLSQMPELREFIVANEMLVRKCAIVLMLQAQYPELQPSYDKDLDMAVFVYNGMVIDHPFLSEDGRFSVSPSYYGLSDSVAQAMHEANYAED